MDRKGAGSYELAPFRLSRPIEIAREDADLGTIVRPSSHPILKIRRTEFDILDKTRASEIPVWYILCVKIPNAHILHEKYLGDSDSLLTSFPVLGRIDLMQ